MGSSKASDRVGRVQFVMWHGRPARESRARCACHWLRHLFLAQVDRVPNEGKSAPGLAAVLWPKAEQDNPAFSQRHGSERNLVLKLIFTSQPTRPQDAFFGVARDDLNFAIIRYFESRTTDEISVGVFRHSTGNRVCGIHVDSQDRSR